MNTSAEPDFRTAELPFAHGGPVGQGLLRSFCEDFVVDEVLGYAASGAGEHTWLTIRKRNLNTHDLARRIARLAAVPQKDIGYAGLKDKRALTTQSFTVRLANRPEPDWSALDDDHVSVMDVARHHRKIRRGALRGNRFCLRIRELTGDPSQLEARLSQLADQGAPNYFGPQRFGTGDSNLQRARAWFAAERLRLSRDQRSLALSAVRSWLFNRIASVRVERSNWNRPLPGDVFQLDGSHAMFLPERDDPAIPARVAALEIHPTGCLAGRGGRGLAPLAAVAQLEADVLADARFWCDGLERAGLDADRRALRLRAHDLAWRLKRSDLCLDFSLDAGVYATTLLRELVVLDEPHGCRRALRDNST